jgi:tRNA threonylcarbamoyladenosine biosynthesis protein TsaB
MAISPQSVVLALDTSTIACSVGIYQNGKALASSLNNYDLNQAEELIPLIQDITKQAGFDLKDVDLISVTTGPGSFTGVRIGLMTAKSLSFALQKPLYGFTNLEVIARSVVLAGCPDDASILAVVESKRQDLYMQFFSDKGELLSEPWSDYPQDVHIGAKDLIFAGDAALKIYEHYQTKSWAHLSSIQHIDLQALADLVIHSEHEQSFVLPYYLRGADVSFSR